MDNATRAQRNVYGLGLIIGPILLAAGTFFWNGVEVGVTGGTIQFYCGIFLTLGIFGLLSLLRPTMPRFAAWMSIVGLLGSFGGANWGMDGVYFEVFKTLGSSATHDVVYETMGPAAGLTLFLPGLCFPLTMLFIGIALFRTKAVPSWCALLLCIGAVAFPASRIPRIEILAHAADLLLLIPCVWIGVRMISSAPEPQVEVAVA